MHLILNGKLFFFSINILSISIFLFLKLKTHFLKLLYFLAVKTWANIFSAVNRTCFILHVLDFFFSKKLPRLSCREFNLLQYRRDSFFLNIISRCKIKPKCENVRLARIQQKYVLFEGNLKFNFFSFQIRNFIRNLNFKSKE